MDRYQLESSTGRDAGDKLCVAELVTFSGSVEQPLILDLFVELCMLFRRAGLITWDMILGT
jgi:hypothetical protein